MFDVLVLTILENESHWNTIQDFPLNMILAKNISTFNELKSIESFEGYTFAIVDESIFFKEQAATHLSGVEILYFDGDYAKLKQKIENIITLKEAEYRAEFKAEKEKVIEQVVNHDEPIEIEKPSDPIIENVVEKNEPVYFSFKQKGFKRFQTKLISVGGLGGTGTTTTALTLASKLSIMGYAVTYLENSSINSYVYDYLNFHKFFNDHDAVKYDALSDIATNNVIDYENCIIYKNIRFLPVFPNTFVESDISNIVKLMFDSDFIVIDFGTRFFDHALSDLLNQSIINLLVIDPEVHKIIRLTDGINDLINRGTNFDYVLNKMNENASLLHLKEILNTNKFTTVDLIDYAKICNKNPIHHPDAFDNFSYGLGDFINQFIPVSQNDSKRQSDASTSLIDSFKDKLTFLNKLKR